MSCCVTLATSRLICLRLPNNYILQGSYAEGRSISSPPLPFVHTHTNKQPSAGYTYIDYTQDTKTLSLISVKHFLYGILSTECAIFCFLILVFVIVCYRNRLVETVEE